MSGGSRFPTARTLAVGDLLRIYDGVIENADSLLEEAGIGGDITAPDMPTGIDSYIKRSEYGDPLPPDDMTEVPPLELGKLFSFFQNWTNYVAAMASRAKRKKEVKDRYLKVIKSALTIYYKEEEKVAGTLLSDKVTCDHRFVDADAEQLTAKLYYDAVSAREDQLRRTLNNISREQTRRANELENQVHDERGGAVRTPAHLQTFSSRS